MYITKPGGLISAGKSGRADLSARIRHVFLTGDRQVGKSTLLRKIIRQYPGKPGGFFTLRTGAFLPGKYSVHLFCAGDEPVPSEEDLLFVCGQAGPDAAERFNVLGCRALERGAGCPLLVMDELGPHEAQAAVFRRAVLACLDGGTPVLGVLQAPARSFWPDITDRPDVLVLEITRQNRDLEETAGLIRAVIG